MNEHIEQAAREDVERVLQEQYDEWLFRMHGIGSSCDHSTEAKHTAQALADAGLLAQPRTTPTRDDVSDAIESCGIAIGTSDAEQAADAALALWPGRTEAEVAAEALERLADDEDREWSESEARIRVSNVRCARCDLRHEEREMYPCNPPGTAHDYDVIELDEAARVVIEPTYDGELHRARAAAIRAGGTP